MYMHMHVHASTYVYVYVISIVGQKVCDKMSMLPQ